MMTRYLAVSSDNGDRLPDIGSRVQVDGQEDFLLGLPFRTFDVAVVGHFETSEDGAAGYFVDLGSVAWPSSTEETFAHRRGVWHSHPGPVSPEAAAALADGSFPQFSELPGLNHDGVVNSIRLYVADPRIEQNGDILGSIRNRFRSYQIDLIGPPMPVDPNDPANLEARPHVIDIKAWDARHLGWTPLDYAVDFGTNATSENPDLVDDLFLIADSQTFTDGGESVLVVVQRWQKPVRRDPIRTVRYSPAAAGGLAMSLPQNGLHVVEWPENSDEVVQAPDLTSEDTFAGGGGEE